MAGTEGRRRTAQDAAWLSSFPGRNPSPVVEANREGRVTYLNPAAQRLFPDLADRGAAHPWLAGLPKLAEAYEAWAEQLLRREVTVGSRVYEQTVSFARGEHQIRVYGWDITERIRAEERLRLSEEKYRLLFQNMGEGFALYELVRDEKGLPVDWRILEVNDAYTLHTGLAREQVVGRRAGELFPAAIAEYLPRFARVVAAQKPEVFETWSASVGRHQAVVTFPAGGDRFANTLTDVTARVLAERALTGAKEELERRVEERTAQLRAVSAELITAEQRERRRLAEYLHDELQQILVGAKLSLGLLQMQARGRRLAVDLQAVEERVAAAIAAARSLTSELSPPVLSAGLTAALEWLALRFREEHGLQVRVRAPRGAEPAEESARILLFQCVRELLFNVVKHAAASGTEVRVSRTAGGRIRVAVRDRGRGFDAAALPGGDGFGIFTIRERMERLGGAMEIRSSPGRGTVVLLSLPAGSPAPARR